MPAAPLHNEKRDEAICWSDSPSCSDGDLPIRSMFASSQSPELLHQFRIKSRQIFFAPLQTIRLWRSIDRQQRRVLICLGPVRLHPGVKHLLALVAPVTLSAVGSPDGILECRAEIVAALSDQPAAEILETIV